MPRVSPVAASASPTSIQTTPFSVSLTNMPCTPLAVQALHNTRSGPNKGVRLDALDDHVKLIFQLAHDTDRICPALRTAMQSESEAIIEASDDLRPFARLPMLVALYITVRQHLAFDNNGSFDTDGLIKFVATRLNESIESAREQVFGNPGAEHAYLGLRMIDDTRGVGAVMPGLIPLGAPPETSRSANGDLVLLSSRLSTTGVPHGALRGMNLRGVVLEDEVFSGLDLSDADLSDACFYRCRWHNVMLERTHLQRLVFYGGELRRCQFTAAKLSSAEFLGCTLSARPLDDGRLDQLPWSGQLARHPIPFHCRLGARFNPTTTGDRHRLALVDTRFDQCDLSEVRFAETQWLKSNVDDCSLSDASVENTVFSQCILVDLNAPRSRWNTVDFSKTTLRRVRCPDSQFEQIQSKNSASLTQVHFERCRLHHMRLETTTTMDDLDFTDARLTKVSFEGSVKVVKERLIVAESPPSPCLNDATFLRTAFDEVQFIQCKLQRTQFKNVQMRGVQFHGCDLGDTRFHDCIDVDLIGSSVRNVIHQTQFTGTRAVISWVWLAGLSDLRGARRQLDFIGNAFGLLGRILSIPDVDIRTQLIVRVLERLSAITDPAAIDSPLLTALTRDEYASNIHIGAYIDRRLRDRLREFNESGLAIPVLSPASAWLTRCPGRLCRLIESLDDPRQFRRYSPLIAFLLIGAKHRALELDESDIERANRIQAASLPPSFPTFLLDSSDVGPATRPLGLFLTEDGNRAVVLHPGTERILFDPVNALLPRRPFIHIVKGDARWEIDKSTPTLQAFASFPMLQQYLRPRFE